MPTTLYNAVLHPLAPFALSGVVWYQGESNTGNPAPYADYLKTLIASATPGRTVPVPCSAQPLVCL